MTKQTTTADQRTALEKFAGFEKRVQTRLLEAQDDCDKFAAKFVEDPAYALEWSNDVFTAAGRVYWIKVHEIPQAGPAAISCAALAHSMT